jgi:putative colanic acid biosynthesis UDP-glucose lipid carrier transferase
MRTATGQPTAMTFRRMAALPIGGGNIVRLIESLLDPVVLIVTLFAAELFATGEIQPPYLLLGVIVFSLTFPGTSRISKSRRRVALGILGQWILIATLLALFGWGTRYFDSFDRGAMLIWLWLAPVALIAAHLALHRFAPAMIRIQGAGKRAIVAGMNQQGMELARRTRDNPLLATHVLGFFDDRSGDRLNHQDEYPIIGRLADLPAYVKSHDVNVIYLSLPMATQPRILDLLDGLRDTTASIYFVPDIFVTDLIQGRIDSVGDVPVVSVCETPFIGMNGLLKRGSDIVLSLLILALISPLLLAIAFGIKLTSAGPVIFKQRRYGLDGKDIVVYKFRSMTVCEDGERIVQAQKNDQRVTALGATLRRTSLDELPQFLNVLQGRMSIVGPRPHAVAHNEEYRTLIRGYMVRHKVKPGITGWAQVNGYRGETDTLEKMRKRIEYDLDYLRNWSLRLDLSIIAKTVLVVLKDRNAY